MLRSLELDAVLHMGAHESRVEEETSVEGGEVFSLYCICLACVCYSWKCSLNDNMKGSIQPSVKDAAVRSANRNLHKVSLWVSDTVEQIPFHAA